MDENVIYKVVNAFLSERIEREIEREVKKQKVEQLAYEDEVPIREKYMIETWLDRVADNAHQVSLNVSHVAKLTHSSSKASNVTDVIQQKDHWHLLTTQTANVAELDLAYTNATLSPIAEFLSLTIEGESKKLGEFLAEDTRYFNRLSDDENIRKNWQMKIAEAYKPSEQASHALAKQVYFPLNDRNSGEIEYHLLSPIKSSALAHKIYLKIRESRDDKNELNKAYLNKEYGNGIYTRYSNIGILSVTKSNHQNASKLNGARSGNLSLFNAMPPKWRHFSQITSTRKLKLEQFFYHCYREEGCAELFKQLKNWISFLEKDRAFLNAERKIFIAEIIQKISEKVFNQVIFLQMRLMNQQEKWENIPAELLPFVLFKNDEEDDLETMHKRLSQEEREAAIDVLIKETARWISERIEDKKRSTHYEKLWISLMKSSFREFYAVMEVGQ